MGIFSCKLLVCDKCGKETIFDGPYSDCGCYSPPDLPEIEVPKLDKETVEEAKKLVDKIKGELVKERLRRNLESEV